MGDYAQAREVFVDMGEQMSRFIYNMNMSWDKFLAFYSDLNNARKEQDDEYEREQAIGEEVDPLDENDMNMDKDHIPGGLTESQILQEDKEIDTENILGDLKKEDEMKEQENNQNSEIKAHPDSGLLDK